MNKKGLHSAILSAILFGMSPVACKAIVGEMPSSLLAGLLYLGSGFSLTGVVLRRRSNFSHSIMSLSWRQWAYLAGTILAGGIAAPLFLAYGIRHGTAAEVSLLLNFEAVATTVLAWVIFHEHIGYRVWIGKIFIIAASILVVSTGNGELQLSISGLAVMAACLFWGIDNNLTRELESFSASSLACIKGWCAGIFNLGLSIFFYNSQVTAFQIAGTLTIGAFSYGISLVLFIYALRDIGSARTSTWFASGPFIGAIFSVILLGERPSNEYWIAALAMLSGMFFLYGEKHLHTHEHEYLTHSHPHANDAHHAHDHDENIVNGMKHDHHHIHEPITHTHVHWPDIYHRHNH